MAQVITSSRVFPSYHPKAGTPTYFVEKILNQLKIDYMSDAYLERLFAWNKVNITNGKLSSSKIFNFWLSLKEVDETKSHTIRGQVIRKNPKKINKPRTYAVGQKFSPRVWSGVPYDSPQIIFFDEIEIKKVWDIKLSIRGDFKEFSCEDEDLAGTSIALIAKNDGLQLNDFLNWFNKPVTGQIICWDENVNY